MVNICFINRNNLPKSHFEFRFKKMKMREVYFWLSDFF